jgi:dipeptide/tripeptide permease
LIVAGGLALASSVLFNWASSKSALWNMGFGVALVLVLATVLIFVVNIAVTRLGY